MKDESELLIFCDYCRTNFPAKDKRTVNISWYDDNEVGIKSILMTGYNFVLCPRCCASLIKALQRGKKDR